MGWKNLGEKPVVHTPWFRLNLPTWNCPAGGAWTTMCSGCRRSCWQRSWTARTAC
jgi:hypothetical protein